MRNTARSAVRSKGRKEVADSSSMPLSAMRLAQRHIWVIGGMFQDSKIGVPPSSICRLCFQGCGYTTFSLGCRLASGCMIGHAIPAHSFDLTNEPRGSARKPSSQVLTRISSVREVVDSSGELASGALPSMPRDVLLPSVADVAPIGRRSFRDLLGIMTLICSKPAGTRHARPQQLTIN